MNYCKEHHEEWYDAGMPCDVCKLEQQVEALTKKYSDLIMQVQAKIPNETRHETARRIIQQHENRRSFTATAQQEGEE